MLRKAVLPAASAEPRAKPPGLLDRILDAVVLKGHGLAVRLERLPVGFGDAGPVDEADPRALRREWLRQLRLWADSSPEELFALKAGALMLGAAIAAMLIVVAVI